MRIPRILAAVALTALLSATAACGDKPASDSALPQAASSDEPDSATADDKEINPEDAMLEYTECMREHGVDMPDPDPNGGAVELSKDSMENMEAASKACDPIMQKVMQDAPANNMDNAKFEEMILAQAKCLRKKGYDVPDPIFEGNGAVNGGTYPDNAHGPAFDKAMKECNDEVGLGDMQMFTSSAGVEQ